MTRERKMALIAAAVVIGIAFTACLTAYARCTAADGHFHWQTWTCVLKPPPGIEIYRDLRRI